jgi:hypothetical protein
MGILAFVPEAKGREMTTRYALASMCRDGEAEPVEKPE